MKKWKNGRIEEWKIAVDRSFIPIFHRIIFCIVIVIACSSSYAQTRDAQLWMSLGIKKKISPLLTASFSQEVRMNENISEAGTVFSDVGLDYKLSKAFKFSVNYRFIQRRRLDDSYGINHRYYFDLSWKKEVSHLVISSRARIQSQYKEYNSSETGRVPEWYWRQKQVLKYSMDKAWSPFIAVELYCQLSNPAGNEFDQAKYSAGVEYELSKAGSLELFYMLQREFNVTRPKHDYIIGIGYSYSLK